MTEKALKLRATYIAKVQRNMKDGIVPDWRIYTIKDDDVNQGASTSRETNGATAMDTEDHNNNNSKPDDDSAQSDDDMQATVEKQGEQKPVLTSTDCVPVIDRGDAGTYKEVMAEIRELGASVVPLQPSADVIHIGVPLDEQWLELIDRRLEELRGYWRNPDNDITTIPFSEALCVDAAPFDKESDPLTIAPLQFPATERLGVALRAFSGESRVRLTQQDLANWEEQLKFVLHSLSFAKVLHTTAVDTHQKDLIERNAQRNEASASKTRRSTRGKAGSDAVTPTLDAYPLIHVEEAATIALNETAKVVVNCLVDIVVARRRAVLAKGATRLDTMAVLTRPITNTNELA